MSTGVENWGIKDWLEAAAYGVAIVGAIAGALMFTLNSRKASIESTRKEIVRTWTNEGDILSSEVNFISLRLYDHDGDIIGTLESPELDRALDVHAVIGWRSTELVISNLQGGRPISVATAEVKIVGNNNRLKWRVVGGARPKYLPKVSTLWPLNLPENG